MNDKKTSFFKYIKLQLLSKINILKYIKKDKQARGVVAIVSTCTIIIIICLIMAIKEVQNYMNIKNESNNTEVVVTINNNSDSKIYKNNNNISIENDYRTAQIIADESLYIRKEPNANSKIIGSLPTDYMIQISYETNGWCKLYNNTGWISAKYIKYIN